MPGESNQRLTIGRLARLCALNVDTVRHYERSGLLKPELRSGAGYRLYGSDSVRRLNFIRRARDLGFTIDEIGQLLAIGSNPDATCSTMLDLTRAKIAEAKLRTTELGQIEQALTQLAEACPGGDTPVCHCPILDYLENAKDEPAAMACCHIP